MTGIEDVRQWQCKKCGLMRSNKETHTHGYEMKEKPLYEPPGVKNET
jgi:hypothetical protein